MTSITSGTVQIFTFKDGILSRVAHDLRIRAEQFEIRPSDPGPDGAAVSADFSPDHLVVEGPMKGGRLEEGGMSAADKREIQTTMRQTLLRSAPIHFDGTARSAGSGYAVDGTLSMAGREAGVRFTLDRRGDRLVGEVELEPSRWGIAPYKALMGAIKLKDQVRVRFDLPAPDTA